MDVAAAGPGGDPLKRPGPTIVLAAVVLAMAVYCVAFLLCPLPSLSEAGGFPWRRLHLLALWLEPETFVEAWFGQPVQFAWTDRLAPLAIAAAIVAWAWLAGDLALRAIGAREGLDRLERLAFSTGVGLNLLSTWTLAAGWAGQLGRTTTLVVPAAATLALAWRQARRRPAPAAVVAAPAARSGELDVRWLWLAAPFALVVLLGGLLPPIEFDVLEYHLQAPKEFYQLGRVDFLPHNLYANMALGTEMLGLLAMVAAGDWWLGALAGKTIIALFAPLGALALFALGRRLFSVGAGVVAAIVYLSAGWVVQVSTLGMVEGASALYLVLALPRTAPSAHRWTAAALSGYCAGAATAVKYPAALFVVAPLMAAWIWLGRREGRGGRPAAVFLLAVAAGCGLWFAKNAVVTGNPTYPLLYEVFGGRGWTPEKNTLWNAVHRPHDFSLGALGSDLGRVAIGSEWLGPLLVPLAALAFVDRRHRRRALVVAGYFAYVIAAWWLTALRIDRYWLPALPLVALLAGAGAGWTDRLAWRRVLMGLLIFGALYDFAVAVSGPGGYNRYFVAYDALRTAPERVGRWRPHFNRQVGDGRLLLVGEAAVFDYHPSLLYNTWLDDSKFEELVGDRPADEVRARLAAAGVTHVFVHWGEIERYRRTGYGRWDAVRPEVFDRLVTAGVLEPLPPLDAVGRGYRVR